MSISLAGQTMMFLYSCVFGSALCMLYDIFRIIRIIFSTGKTTTALLDLLYFFLAAIFSFLFFMTTAQGELRGYLLLGELIGWIIYYESIGTLLCRLEYRSIRWVRKKFFLLRSRIGNFLNRKQTPEQEGMMKEKKS